MPFEDPIVPPHAPLSCLLHCPDCFSEGLGALNQTKEKFWQGKRLKKKKGFWFFLLAAILTPARFADLVYSAALTQYCCEGVGVGPTLNKFASGQIFM